MPDEVQPPEGQGQPVAPAATVAEPAPGPWASDLDLLGLDPAARASVDLLLRTKVQPYTTKLEQDLSAARPGITLYNDLTDKDKSVDTFVSVTYEMFGQDAGDSVLAALQGKSPEEQQAVVAEALAAPAPAAAPAAPQYAQLDPDTQAFLNEQRQAAALSQYEKDMAATIAANPDVIEDKLHIWVAQADGDWNKAVALYRDYNGTTATPDLTSVTPPAVLGSDTGGASASNLPIAPKTQTMAEAIENTMNMLKRQEAPAVVG